jgi:hypothetical protein
MADLVHNERVKYRATFCNNVGVVAFSSGVILPILQGHQSLGVHIGVFGAGGLVAAMFVALSQWTLAELKE